MAPEHPLRPIDWDGDHIRLLDQTLLPDEVRVLAVRDVGDLLDAIGRLAVRGAPALGVTGALGVALAVRTLPAAEVPDAVARLRSARPTAVNLARGVDLAAARIPDGPAAVLATALALRDAEIAASEAMATRGAALLTELCGPGRLRLLTICNTGALAAVERGTALAVVEQVHREGRLARVIACETRPLLQGARLTAWELGRMGAPYALVVDGAAASVIGRGLVDAVLVGADRVAANGDVANKVGTFALALAARYAAAAPVPFLVVAPESTVDAGTPDGAAIEIEDRGSAEVVGVRGVRVAPAGAGALNPAFDVTPARLVTALVTDRRVVRQPA